jgi:hypothetical protein
MTWRRGLYVDCDVVTSIGRRSAIVVNVAHSAPTWLRVNVQLLSLPAQRRRPSGVRLHELGWVWLRERARRGSGSIRYAHPTISVGMLWRVLVLFLGRILGVLLLLLLLLRPLGYGGRAHRI